MGLENGKWKVRIGPDRYYMVRTSDFMYWDQADDLCGNYWNDSQLAIPHSGEDVHFIREHVIRPHHPKRCSWVGKFVMTT